MIESSGHSQGTAMVDMEATTQAVPDQQLKKEEEDCHGELEHCLWRKKTMKPCFDLSVCLYVGCFDPVVIKHRTI